jgi:tripartite ATP-independent transporter DctP family solute receptor
MERITRRRLVGIAATAGVTAAAGLGLRPRRAFAAGPEFTFKIGNPVPASHPMNVRNREAAEQIKKESGGRMELQVFAASQLGGDTDMLSQTRTGALELEQISPLILSTLVPNASINGIGFAFKDYPAVWAAMDGALGAYVRGEIQKRGLHTLDKIWDNGFRQITTSTRVINGPADLKGLKIRVPVSPLWTSLFQAFDAAPTSINFVEVYSSLQTHIVEGEENPLAVIETAKLYEVQKHCAMTNHMWDGFWLVANPTRWNALPPDLQTMAARILNAASLQERDDVAKLNASLQGTMEKQGMIFNTPPTEPFRAALKKAGFYAQWHKKYGDDAWSILAKYAAGLG